MTLVEGFDDDAVALARLLANEGRDVTLAGAGRPRRPHSSSGQSESRSARTQTTTPTQSPSDAVVVNEDDPDAVAIAAQSPGRRIGFSAARELPVGVSLRGTTIVGRSGDEERTFARPPGLDAPRLQGLLGALATTLAVGAPPERLPGVRSLPFRHTVVGRRGAPTARGRLHCGNAGEDRRGAS